MDTDKWELQVTNEVKIRQHDNYNFTILVLTKGINPRTKEEVESYKILGYYSSIRRAILALLDRDVLIDLNQIETIRDYVKASKRQRDKIAELLEGDYE